MTQVNSLVQSVEEFFYVHVMHTRNRPRLIAAILYLAATCFFAGIVSILSTTWGKEGLGQALAAGSAARPAVIYLLVAGAFSLAASILLFSPLSLSKPQQRGLLASALMLMLAGMVVAAPSVVVSIVPFWFLLRFYRESGTPPHDSPAADSRSIQQ